MDRPILLGMNDPSGTEALSPCDGAGRRLAEMAVRCGGISLAEYLSGFERRNLLSSRKWSDARAKVRGHVIRRRLVGREVIVLGRQVWRALGLPAVPYFSAVGLWRLVPHPSGRNLIYNSEVARMALGEILADAAP